MRPGLLQPIGRGENRCRRRGTGHQCRAQRRASEPAYLRALRRSACHVPTGAGRASSFRNLAARQGPALEGRRRIMARGGSAAPVWRAREGAAGPRNALLAAAAARRGLGHCCTGAVCSAPAATPRAALKGARACIAFPRRSRGACAGGRLSGECFRGDALAWDVLRSAGGGRFTGGARASPAPHSPLSDS